MIGRPAIIVAQQEMSGCGPQQRFAAMQQDVGNRGQTGRSANTARTAGLDPKRIQRPVFGR
jgi:hypothetical protein